MQGFAGRDPGLRPPRGQLRGCGGRSESRLRCSLTRALGVAMELSPWPTVSIHQQQQKPSALLTLLPIKQAELPERPDFWIYRGFAKMPRTALLLGLLCLVSCSGPFPPLRTVTVLPSTRSSCPKQAGQGRSLARPAAGSPLSHTRVMNVPRISRGLLALVVPGQSAFLKGRS